MNRVLYYLYCIAAFCYLGSSTIAAKKAFTTKKDAVQGNRNMYVFFNIAMMVHIIEDIRCGCFTIVSTVAILSTGLIAYFTFLGSDFKIFTGDYYKQLHNNFKTKKP